VRSFRILFSNIRAGTPPESRTSRASISRHRANFDLLESRWLLSASPVESQAHGPGPASIGAPGGPAVGDSPVAPPNPPNGKSMAPQNDPGKGNDNAPAPGPAPVAAQGNPGKGNGNDNAPAPGPASAKAPVPAPVAAQGNPGKGNGNEKGDAPAPGPAPVAAQDNPGKGNGNGKGDAPAPPVGPLAAQGNSGKGNGNGKGDAPAPVAAQDEQVGPPVAPAQAGNPGGAGNDLVSTILAQVEDALGVPPSGAGNAPASGRVVALSGIAGAAGPGSKADPNAGSEATASATGGDPGGKANPIPGGKAPASTSTGTAPALARGQSPSGADPSTGQAAEGRDSGLAATPASPQGSASPSNSIAVAAGPVATQPVANPSVPVGPRGPGGRGGGRSTGLDSGGVSSSNPIIILASGSDTTDKGTPNSSHPGNPNGADDRSATGSVAPLNQGNLPSASSSQFRLAHGSEGDRSRPDHGADAGGGSLAGSEGMAGAISDALDCLFGQGGESPFEVDRLAESLPFDPALLDRAVAQCLAGIDDLGDSLADLLRSDRLPLWLYGTALATTASVAAGRWARKTTGSRLGDEGEEVMPSWILGLEPEKV